MGTPAKITFPDLPDLPQRPRLAHLFATRRHTPAVWITGAPGAGKTTALVRHLRAQAVPVLWYRCDPDDCDPLRVCRFLLLAAIRLNPALTQRQLPSCLSSAVEMMSLARGFFRELFAALPPSLHLVFDDYQRVERGSLTHELLAIALDELPAGRRLVLCGRSRPPSAYVRACANGALDFIEARELQLEHEEVGILMREHGAREMADTDIARLQEITRGWAAGIMLLGPKGSQTEIAIRHGNRAGLIRVYDYFEVEVMAALSQRSQHILMATALLPIASAALVIALTGLADAGDVLSVLCEQNIFVEHDPRFESCYALHPLFRQFLLHRLEKRAPSTENDLLKTRAIGVLSECGQAEAALALCGAESHYGMLEVLLCQHAPALVRQKTSHAVMTVLQGLDDRTAQRHPWFFYWRGMAQRADNPAAGLDDLRRAFDGFRLQGNAEGSFRSWAAVVQAIVRDTTSNQRLLDTWLNSYEVMASTCSAFPNPETEGDVAYSMFMALHFRLPQDQRLPYWRDRALVLRFSGKDLSRQHEALTGAALHDLLQGHHARAAVYVSSLQAFDCSLVSASPFDISLRTGFFDIQVGEFEATLAAASQVLAQVLAQVTSQVLSPVSFATLMHGTFAALATGERKLAGAFLRQMAPQVQRTHGSDGWYFHVLVSWLAFTDGNVALSRAHVEQAEMINGRINNLLRAATAGFILAQLRFCQGESAEAHVLLQTALQSARRLQNQILEHMCLMLQAHFALVEQRYNDSTLALEQGLKVGRSERFVSFLFWRPDVMSELCSRALEYRIEPGYVCHLIRQRALAPPDGAPAAWPWPMKIVTLDGFTVCRNGSPVLFSRKAPKKLIALLKAIICLGSRNVGRAQLMDALWPEQDADRADDAMEKALQRLRTLLGDDVLLIQAGRISLNPRTVWVDAWDCEARLDQSRSDPASEGSALAAVMLAYRQRFLAADEEQWWTVAMRERLHAKYLRAIFRVGRMLISTHQYDGALHLYEQALEIDEFNEELCQASMQCLDLLGRRTAAIALYYRLRQNLAKSRAALPTSVTQSYYRTLIERE